MTFIQQVQAGCLAFAAVFSGGAWAQTAASFPARAVTLVVPTTPGSGADAVSRLIAGKLSERWGVPVVVDNKAGASTQIGSTFVAKAAPDGHTLLMLANSTVITAAVSSQVTYNMKADFAPVAKLGDAKFVLAVTPSFPARDIAGLMAHARKNPGKINFASPGNGSPHHFAIELLKLRHGLHIVHIPYKGIAGAMTDVMGGQVEMIFTSVTSALPYLRSGRLRAVGVTGTARSALVPDVPTFVEQRVDAMEGVDTWFGVAAPAKTPAEVVQRLNRDFNAVVNSPDMRADLAKQGITALNSTPGEFATTISGDLVRWKQMATATRITFD